MMISQVEKVFGNLNLSNADDMASDVILKIWQRRDEFDDPNYIRAYANAYARHTLHAWQAKHKNEKHFEDFAFRDEGDVLERLFFVPANQHKSAEAAEALAMWSRLPKENACVLEILIDGGSPLDVARELEISVPEAMQRIKEARRLVHLV